ncbi:hypothetical protein GCM10017771_46760 [Streptomyces capitiformicae]|uniref:Uncharacterized protein n=1 Tax=Streptomyces capitiformicae TaxID=2014920 RepID=A0A918Z073_9ACTN|nr:hypothetical protein GCM10017771_46760 [Streptomyces capitiformicae]
MLIGKGSHAATLSRAPKGARVCVDLRPRRVGAINHKQPAADHEESELRRPQTAQRLYYDSRSTGTFSTGSPLTPAEPPAGTPF